MNAGDGTDSSLRAAPRCSRRAFLLTVLVGALAATGCGEQDASRSPDGAPQWLPGAVGDVDAAARLGRAYLQANPGENNLDTLLAAIDAALVGGSGAGESDTQRVLTALQHTVRAEYLRGESVNVQGWVLSVTEARVYAALALATDS
jgi:hypothetical protein